MNWRGFVGAMVAATLCLMLFGIGDTLAASPTHAVATSVHVSDDALTAEVATNDFIDTIFTGPRPVWETRSHLDSTSLTQNNMVDRTQWFVTSRLVAIIVTRASGDLTMTMTGKETWRQSITAEKVFGGILTNGGDYRSEWSTTTRFAEGSLELLSFDDGGNTYRTQMIDPIGFISVTIAPTSADGKYLLE